MKDESLIIAGTGHRPHKLGGYERLTEIRCIRLTLDFLRELRKTREIKEIITGMAMGWDQALAEAALMLDIPLMAYLPCRNMHKHWTSTSQERWLRILNRADGVFSASREDYVGPWCMQKRNEMMVDDCNMILALWDGSDGGTANCIGYANRKHPDLEFVNLWGKWAELNGK